MDEEDLRKHVAKSFNIHFAGLGCGVSTKGNHEHRFVSTGDGMYKIQRNGSILKYVLCYLPQANDKKITIKSL